MDEFVETRATLLAEATSTPGRYRIQLINPGWGSSGYYSGEVLAEAATRQVFPAGLHMYAGHPNADGSGIDGSGARNVRDLWGVLESDATIGADGALVAEARVFTPYQPLVEDMRDAIGLSIRAAGIVEAGEAEGRQGAIITSVDEARSVDFVTAAGRGGRVLELIESARVEPKAEVAEAFPGGFTANDLRDALCSKVSEEYGGEEKYAWVRDYTDTQVIFELDGNVDKRGNFRQSYSVDGSTVVLVDDREEVTPKTTWEPVTESATPPGDQPGNTAPTAHTEETHMPDTPGADGTTAPPTPRSVVEAELSQLRRVAAQSRARDRAREVITEALSQAWLPPLTVVRITNDLLESSRLPIDDQDQLDEVALTAAANTARDQAEREVAEAMQASGMGRPRSLGASPLPTAAGPNLEESLEESFRDLGMTESAAKIAAKGR